MFLKLNLKCIKSPIHRQLSSIISISDLLLEAEEAVFIFEFWTHWRVDQHKTCFQMFIKQEQMYYTLLDFSKRFYK